jgi:hypothetical protein
MGLPKFDYARRATTMPIYNLAVHDGSRLEDDGGIELPNDAAARTYALQVIGELKKNNGNRWNGWKIEVTESDRQVFDIPFS